MMTNITTQTLMNDDVFRNAFQAIARKAVPFMEHDAYFSDLLHDAASSAKLQEDERLYIMVRSLGTFVFKYGDDAIEKCDEYNGLAVLRVIRGKYDTFDVKVIYCHE